MKPAILTLCALMMASSAHASGGGGADKPAEPSEIQEADPSIVEMPMLVAPVTVNGRLYHYAYMRVLLKAKSNDIAWEAREKTPFILDALLRETHRSSIALNGDPKSIDGEGLKKRLLQAANTAMGRDAFVSVSFRDTIQTDGEPDHAAPPS